eukprot:98195-Pelagomonas_calceolata.AAC.6
MLMMKCPNIAVGQDSKSPNITQSGAVGGQEWRSGSKKVGFTPRLIWQARFNLGQINSSAVDYKLKCPRLGHTYAGKD